LLGVNSIVSIKSLFEVTNHTLQGSVFTLISTHLLLLPDCQTDTEWEGTPHLFHSWVASQLTFSYTLTQHGTFIPLPEPERHDFIPQIFGYQDVPLGGDQDPLLHPGAGLNLNLGSYQSDEQ
jgi:hypothetical protein